MLFNHNFEMGQVVDYFRLKVGAEKVPQFTRFLCPQLIDKFVNQLNE